MVQEFALFLLGPLQGGQSEAEVERIHEAVLEYGGFDNFPSRKRTFIPSVQSVLRWESAGVYVREDDMKSLAIRDAEDVAREEGGEDRLDEVTFLDLGLHPLLEVHANSPGLLL